MKKIIKNQFGTILFVVITFVFITQLLFLLIFKIYFSTIEIIKDEKKRQKQYNELLNPQNNINSKIKKIPSQSSNQINFNLIFDNATICNDTIPKLITSEFTSTKFCNISNLNDNVYIGNLIGSLPVTLKSNILITSGSIILDTTLILTQNVTFILSFGNIEIKNIVGLDTNQVYFIFLKSGNNKITLSNASNVFLINETPEILYTIFPTYKENILCLK